MPNYNFLDLSPVDFEELTRDLLQKHFAIFLESFKEGRDQGIDLRYSCNNENTIIIQCKRYASVSDLKKNLRLEVKKVKKLYPQRYIVVTSVNLTPKQKTDIKNIFKGIKLYLKDIFGKKDINNLLSKYPQIEKGHYKLWFNSTSVLEKILHNSIYNRSDFEKEEIEREIKLYVTNESNKEATQILNQNNYVIISGIPGIGKTTLARMLLYNFLLEDWELISVSTDIKEAEDVYQKGKLQVFYYDDFLGTNFLAELISKNEDKRIIKFIEMVKKSKDKKLIMTTREYILNQAIQKFESLHDKSLEIGKCTIDLEKYTKLIKGKILYNHLFYSELNYSFFNDILKENRFLKIINHPNYNPRLIQYLTDKKFLDDTSSSNYYNFFIENLANPQYIWQYAYNSHISSVSRYLLIVFLSLGEPVLKEDLYCALTSFFERNDKHYGIKINKVNYDKSLRECEKTFLMVEKNAEGKIIIRFQNPSIKDFLLHYLNNYPELVKHMINSCIFFNQFFDIYSTNIKDGAVYLEKDIQKISFTRLKKIFYSIPVSILTQKYDLETSKFVWTHSNFTNVERLSKLSRFYNLSISNNVLDFLYKEFTQINLEEEIYGSYEMNDYLVIVDKINKYKKLDGTEIIEKFFSKEKIENFEEIKEANKLKYIFPNEYNIFEKNKNYEVGTIIEDVLSNEFSDLERNLDKDKIDDFIEELVEVEDEYNLSLDDFRNKATELKNEIEDEQEDKTKEIKNLSSPDMNFGNDDEVLINIFNTLKFNK